MKKALTTRHRPVDRDPSNPDFQTISHRYQNDPERMEERSKQRMRERAEKLR